MSRLTKKIIVGGVALAAATLCAAPAGAATTCTFGGGVLTVALNAPGDDVKLRVAPGGQIVVSSVGAPIGCATTTEAPTNTTTSTIFVFSRPEAGSNPVAIADPSQFAPGASVTDEQGGDREIEIAVTLNDDPVSHLFLEGSEDADSFRFGTDAINPNAHASEVAPDGDIFLSGVTTVGAAGRAGADALSGAGGAGTGSAFAGPLTLIGEDGADRLGGGAGDDELYGNAGNDRLDGLGGNDTLVPGTNNDALDGGPGADVVDYTKNPAGVDIDLAIVGPQFKGGAADTIVAVEDAYGSTAYPDILRGDAGPNRLYADGGADVVDGRGGDDWLDGGAGTDRLVARDGGPDHVDCGDDADTVTADARGTDTLEHCENALFPPPASGGASPRDTLAPAFVGRVRVRRGTFRYSLSEAATVTLVIRRGRKRVRALRVAARAGANRTRLRRRLRPGRYRARLTAVDAGGNVSAPASVRFQIRRQRAKASADGPPTGVVYWSNRSGPDRVSYVPLNGADGGSLNVTGTNTTWALGLAIDTASGRIYWADADKISSAALDGSGGARDLNTSGATVSLPIGLAIDPVTRRIYWANFIANTISYADLDGRGGGNLDTTGASVIRPSAVAVDPVARRIYWTNANPAKLEDHKISFADLDGRGAADLDTTGATVHFPQGVAVDPAAGRVYWANGDAGADSISFANLDGSGGGGHVSVPGATRIAPMGLAIDPVAQRIYWANSGAAKISVARLDGSGAGDLQTVGVSVSGAGFPVVVQPPAGAGAPTITGGSTLSCSPGSWSPDQVAGSFYRAPTQYSYRWTRDGATIAGATATTLAPAAAGDYRCVVTGSNPAGAASQTSAPRHVAGPSNAFTFGRLVRHRRRGTATLTVNLPGPGTLTATGRGLVRRQQTTARLLIKASGSARRRLKRRGRLAVTLRVTFTPTAGTAKTRRKRVTLLAVRR